jgi:hypothetical protein
MTMAWSRATVLTNGNASSRPIARRSTRCPTGGMKKGGFAPPFGSTALLRVHGSVGSRSCGGASNGDAPPFTLVMMALMLHRPALKFPLSVP